MIIICPMSKFETKFRLVMKVAFWVPTLHFGRVKTKHLNYLNGLWVI